MSTAVTALFQPLKVGAIDARNRFFMAPLTRCRASRTHVPNDLMATYYAQRASAGIVITEATTVADKASAFMTEGGLFNDETAQGWKGVVDAVHAKQGKIVAQLYHPGRSAVPLNDDGAQPVSATDKPISSGHVAPEFNPTNTKIDYAVPRVLKDEELPEIVNTFVQAAKRAIAVGFDGIEIHAANGYLLDQFLRNAGDRYEGSNYGGSIENNSRLTLEVVDGIIAAIGADRVGIRLSPLNQYQSMKHPEAAKLTEYICTELDKRNIAYLHLMRADFFGPVTINVVEIARKHFKNTLVVNMGYQPTEAEETVKSGVADAVAFGTLFLANPDLPERVKAGAALNAPNPATFYTPGPEGYTDYSFAKLSAEASNEAA